MKEKMTILIQTFLKAQIIQVYILYVYLRLKKFKRVKNGQEKSFGEFLPMS